MYLLTQIWIYLASAFAAGALVGYGAWAWCQRRAEARPEVSAATGEFVRPASAVTAESDDEQEAMLRREIEDARREAEAAQAAIRQRHAAETARLQSGIEAFRREAEARAGKEQERHAAELAELHRQLAAARSEAAAGSVVHTSGTAMAPAPKAKRATASTKKTGPHRLKAPRKGKADDLTLIAGIGPDLKARLNRLGIWHFEQIAKWTPEDARIIAAELGVEAGGGNGLDGPMSTAPQSWISDAHRLATG